MKRAERWQEPEGLTLLRGWARDNVPEAEIAKRMGLSLWSLNRLRKRAPQVDAALRQRGEAVDYQVEEALLKAAVGYRYTEEKVEQTDKGDKVVSTEKESGPNVSAISLWLKRRRPEVWDEEAAGAAAKQAENNLFSALGDWEKEVFDRNGIPELQSAAEAGADVVETAGVSGA